MVTRLPAGALVPIHASEQARAVEWLLDHVDIDERWSLIHATSMTPAEIGSLAASGGVTGLCPITDANPGGDGFHTAMRRVLQ